METGLLHERVESTSVDDVAARARQTYRGFDIRSDHRFRFRMQTTSGPRFTVSRMQMSGDVLAVVDMDEVVTVGIPLSGRLAFEHPRMPVDARRTYLLSDGVVRGAWQDFDVRVLTFTRPEIEAYAGRLAGTIRPLRFTGSAPIDAAHDLRWRAAVDRVVREIIPNPVATSSELVRKQVFRALTTTMLETFPNTWRDEVAAARAPARSGARGVVRALEHIYGNLEQDLDVADLAEVAGLSVRGLQAAFRREFDATPGEVVRDARLDAAHLALASSGPDETTVGAIAVRFGFGNPGRFAARYRERFGESPAATLRG